MKVKYSRPGVLVSLVFNACIPSENYYSQIDFLKKQVAKREQTVKQHLTK